MMLNHINPKLLVLALGLGYNFVNAGPSCSDLTFTVSAHSQPEEIILPPLDVNNTNPISDLLNGVVGNVGRLWPPFRVGGDYDISATYCEPEDASDVDTVELLGHGATYNKRYWTGHGLPDEQAKKYSWVHYAAEKGYAALAIDRLGVGNSSHPDGALEVQQSLSAEVIHEVVSKLRNGEIANKKFSKVVYVGHSMGSLIGNVATQRNSGDFDAVILTGWSANFIENFVSVLLGLLLPASIEDPERFGHLAPTYLTFALKPAVRLLFYGPKDSFDPKVKEHDWKHRDTVGLGEMVSILAGTNPSPFANPVKVINGELDASFCSPAQKCSPGPNGPPGNTADIFKKSSNFTYDIIPNTGHDLNLHYSAQKTFESAHEFLRYNLG